MFKVVIVFTTKVYLETSYEVAYNQVEELQSALSVRKDFVQKTGPCAEVLSMPCLFVCAKLGIFPHLTQ